MIGWYIGVAYYIVAVLYLMIRRFKSIYMIVLVLGIPFFGILVAELGNYYSKKYEEEEKFGIAEETKMDFFRVQEVNVQKEIDVVPMDEALSLNEVNIRRQAVMRTLLSDNLEEYLSVLQKALGNEDTETSHYATTVILEMQNKVMDTLMKQEVAYRSNPRDEEIMYLLNDSLLKVINSGLFNERNIIKYNRMYVELSDHILMRDIVDEHYLFERIQYDFKQKNYTHAYSLCKRYKIFYPSSEDMVLCHIQYYVDTKDRDGLTNFLKEVKTMPVVLSQKTLQFIRFFN